MRPIIFRVCSAAILFLLAFQNANAADLVVITNQDISISPSDIKDVFLGEKQFAGSSKLIVVDNATAQGSFLSKFMNMDATKYNGIWTKKSFRDGLTAPALKSGDIEVIEYIKRTPGSVGYVTTKPSGVKIIQ
jgi:hypothetical protein